MRRMLAREMNRRGKEDWSDAGAGSAWMRLMPTPAPMPMVEQSQQKMEWDEMRGAGDVVPLTDKEVEALLLSNPSMREYERLKWQK